MIPIKLEIKNFASYGPKIQTIGFDPYNLICLTGKNGHGKSALLDALTWAIWGQARKIGGTAKADEGLLRLGQTNMMVCLDFKCNNVIYRIKREFTQSSKKAISNLEFGIIDSVGEQFKALTDKTIKATQEKIESMIGIDYETFINTAFLRQGQSNEFSKKTPKERKEILASILGLDKFENLRKLAMQKARDSQTQASFKKQIIDELSKEIEQKNVISSKLEILNNNLKALLSQDNNLKLEIMTVNQKLENINETKNIIQQINFKKEQTESFIKDQTQELLQNFHKWRDIHRSQKKLKDYKEIDREYNHIYQELKNLQNNAIKNLNLKEKIMALKEAEQDLLKKLNEEFNNKLEQLKIQEQKLIFSINNLELKEKDYLKQLSLSEQEKIETELELKILESNISTVTKDLLEKETKQFEKRKEYYHKFIAQANAIKNDLKSLLQNKEVIKLQEANCPLCQQNLSENHKLYLEQNFKTQESFLNHQINRLTKVINNLKNILISQHEYIEGLKLKFSNQEINLFKKNQLIQNLDKSAKNIRLTNNELNIIINNLALEKKALEKTLIDINLVINSQQNLINNNEVYLEIKNNIIKLNQELNSIEFNPEKQLILSKKLEELDKIKQEQIFLFQDIALQNERKENINKLIKQIKQLKNRKKELEKETAKYLDLISQEENIKNQLNLINLEFEKLKNEKEKNIHQSGALEQELKSLNEKEKYYFKEKELVSQLNESAEDYNAISLALSKDGIQALLIEDAIPEIEEEANNLLSKLTDNQAHLSMESLRDLKSGDQKETLDIKISDAMGIRPYELFSGGEAFRIDFALRIAISKLLARRAGTSLQTLIIDEGFGSQDEEGLANIMSAIYKIQEDFEKIIIVSHLASMKEQFPVNFFIYKSPEGSVVRVIEQD